MPRKCPECDWIWPKPTGSCPNCGSDKAPPAKVAFESGDVIEGKVPTRMPISLAVLVVAFVVYLAWRIVQMVTWLF